MTISTSSLPISIQTAKLGQIVQPSETQAAVTQEQPQHKIIDQTTLIDPMNPVLNAGLQGFIMDFSLVQQQSAARQPRNVEEVISSYEAAKSRR